MKKLPLGLQDFGELRRGDFLYVDKTEQLHQLVMGGKYYFLSRPRRFGKSLLVSTLAELFRGNQKLFEGLWIHDHWDWQQTYPVIELHLNQGTYKVIGLEAFLTEELELQAEAHGISLQGAAYPSQLRHLVTALSEKYGRVAVLIDEYDKPILDYLDDVPQAQANREILKNFYSVLKPLDPHLRFVLLTGVSKFSRVSIFSELNNLTDLTLHPRYTTLLGYTQEELEHYFADHIDPLAANFGGREVLLARIKQWYNGYSWDAQHFVYNPYSVLSFFDQGDFQNFWFETGTPTFLVKLLNRQRKYDLKNLQVSALVLSAFEIERIDAYTLLFQTGYLTICARNEQTYTLSYPNQEVKHALLQYLLAEYSGEYPSQTAIRALQLKQALDQADVAEFVATLNSLFASIPYQIFIADREAYYHSVIFLALSLVDLFIQVEVSQAQGRPDAVVHTEQAIYVLEFKLDQRAEVALQQITAHDYAAPYRNRGKAVKAVGFNFSSEQKAIDQWEEQVVVGGSGSKQ